MEWRSALPTGLVVPSAQRATRFHFCPANQQGPKRTEKNIANPRQSFDRNLVLRDFLLESSKQIGKMAQHG
jgi:hypothetical protein